jgi:glycosyltransferase involved in cell wall biosynthesis
VDVANFPPPPLDTELQARLGLGGMQVAGFIGSLYRYEGLQLLLQAVAALAPRLPRLRCLIVGGGYDGEEEELRAQAKALGIADRVLVQGKVPHEAVARYYSLIDILVYPRVRSRLLELVTPLKPLEAMSMEKAVVGSDVGGIKELIEDGVNGVLFRADDAAHLAATLEQLFSDDARRESLRKSGRRYVEEHRAWAKLIRVHAEVYRRLGLPARA